MLKSTNKQLTGCHTSSAPLPVRQDGTEQDRTSMEFMINMYSVENSTGASMSAYSSSHVALANRF